MKIRLLCVAFASMIFFDGAVAQTKYSGWQTVMSVSGVSLFRLETPEGWIARVVTSKGAHTLFVPDAKKKWVATGPNEICTDCIGDGSFLHVTRTEQQGKVIVPYEKVEAIESQPSGSGSVLVLVSGAKYPVIEAPEKLRAAMKSPGFPSISH